MEFFVVVDEMMRMNHETDPTVRPLYTFSRSFAARRIRSGSAQRAPLRCENAVILFRDTDA